MVPNPKRDPLFSWLPQPTRRGVPSKHIGTLDCPINLLGSQGNDLPVLGMHLGNPQKREEILGDGFLQGRTSKESRLDPSVVSNLRVGTPPPQTAQLSAPRDHAAASATSAPDIFPQNAGTREGPRKCYVWLCLFAFLFGDFRFVRLCLCVCVCVCALVCKSKKQAKAEIRELFWNRCLTSRVLRPALKQSSHQKSLATPPPVAW